MVLGGLMSSRKEQSARSMSCLASHRGTHSQTAELVPWDVTTKNRNWEMSD